MSESLTSPEMIRFDDALRQAVLVSKGDLKRILAEEKTKLPLRKAGRKATLRPSAPASLGMD